MLNHELFNEIYTKITKLDKTNSLKYFKFKDDIKLDTPTTHSIKHDARIEFEEQGKLMHIIDLMIEPTKLFITSYDTVFKASIFSHCEDRKLIRLKLLWLYDQLSKF